MKLVPSLLAALAAAGLASAQDCSTYQQSVQTLGFSLDFVADMANGLFRGQLAYEGIGWVGFAVSPNGLMEGSRAVLGLAASLSFLWYYKLLLLQVIH